MSGQYLTGCAQRRVVVKIGGGAIGDDAVLARICDAIAGAIDHTQVAAVHGGGATVDEHLAGLGIVSRRRDGIRITPPEHVEHVDHALSVRANGRVVAALRAAGAPARGLRLGQAGVDAQKVEHAAIDLGRVGRVTGGRGEPLRRMLDDGLLPVVSSIGADAGGDLLNVNADEAAGGVAGAIGADAVVFLTGVAGVLDGLGRVVGRIDAESIERMIAEGTICDGMIPKVRSAHLAAHQSGIPAVICPWDEPEAIVRAIRGAGVGTRVVPGHRRPARRGRHRPLRHIA